MIDMSENPPEGATREEKRAFYRERDAKKRAEYEESKRPLKERERAKMEIHTKILASMYDRYHERLDALSSHPCPPYLREHGPEWNLNSPDISGRLQNVEFQLGAYGHQDEQFGDEKVWDGVKVSVSVLGSGKYTRVRKVAYGKAETGKLDEVMEEMVAYYQQVGDELGLRTVNNKCALCGLPLMAKETEESHLTVQHSIKKDMQAPILALGIFEQIEGKSAP